MKSPNDYWDYARECMEMAERSRDPDVKALMRDLAKLWTKTALSTERQFALSDAAAHPLAAKPGKA